MKHIIHNLRLKAWVRAPGVDFGGGADAKNIFFEYVHVA